MKAIGQYKKGDIYLKKTITTIIIVVLIAVLGIGGYFLVTSMLKNAKYRVFDNSEDPTKPSFYELLQPFGSSPSRPLSCAPIGLK